MADPAPLAGRLLRHYRVIEEIGRGGMGVVWRALDTRLERTVALKMVHPDLLADPDTRRRFLQEARAASAITHANVCTIHAIEEEEGQLFLVLEYLEGSTLQERAPELRHNFKALLDTLTQAADGLAEAHRRGVVHRDIKSTNIWTTPRGQVKIMDFGLAKTIREAQRTSDEAATQELTLAGMTVGTIHYMSPEQALGRTVDPRSDIFSFGVVLYESACGRRPFSGATPVETFDQILHLDPTPPSSLDPNLPAEFDRIVLKTLRKDPEERYQTAADLVVDLKALRRSLESGQHPISRTMTAASSGSYAGAAAGMSTPSGGTRAAPTPSQGFAAAGATTPSAAYSAAGVAPAPAGPAPARHSTLGSVALVVTAMLAVVGITLGGVAWLGRKEAPPPVAAAGAKPALAVMAFENRTGEPRYNWYGENTSELLRVVLAQLENLSVISKQRLYDVLREMKVEGDASDPRVATEVAKRSGATIVIRGNALMVGGSVVLTAEVVNVADGTVVGAERVTGVDEENMLDKVDELGRLLSERLRTIE